MEDKRLKEKYLSRVKSIEEKYKKVTRNLEREINNFLDQETIIPKENTNELFMYKPKELSDKNENFDSVCNFLNLHKHIDKTTNEKILVKPDNKSLQFKVFAISCDNNEDNNNSLLLFHGSLAKNIKGILSSGFKPSVEGTHGPGVYLTDKIEYSYNYSNNFIKNGGEISECYYIFVCKVKVRDNYELQHNKHAFGAFEEYKKRPPFNYPERIFNNLNKKVYTNLLNRTKFINSSFYRVSELDKPTICVVHHSLVQPVFLLQIKNAVPIQTLVDNFIYIKNTEIKKHFSGNKKSFRKKEFKHMVNDELQSNMTEEIELNRKKLKLLPCSEKYQKNINIQAVLSPNKKYMFIIDRLDTSHTDYKFLKNSLRKITDASYPNIESIYRLTDRSLPKSAKKRCCQLLLHGITCEKIEQVLTNGYNDVMWSEETECFGLCQSLCKFEDCVRKASNYISGELMKGKSFRDNSVKNVSYIFVIFDPNEVTKSSRYLLEDSTGKFVGGNTFNYTSESVTCEIVCDKKPSYLIVVGE